MSGRVGFMQGRLSPLVNGRIQAFPWDHWREEFPIAHELGFPLIEWTLDQDRLRENPLLADPAGVASLAAAHGLRVASITGDCFMQAPFYKETGAARDALLDDMAAILDAAAAAAARFVVVPLVDNGRLENAAQRQALLDGLLPLADGLAARGLCIAFESDFAPADLAGLMHHLPAPAFGVNYDIGNSAALGFDPAEEMAAYATRIVNVHVKDRVLGGTTVPLGTGAADLPRVFALLREAGYGGDFILQTSRATDGDHAGALARYRDMTAAWWAATAE